MKRTLARIAIGGVVVLALLAATVLAVANRTVAPPSLAQRQLALNRAIEWMLSNKEAVLNDPNPALWWMVRHAADITRDARLHALQEESVQRVYPPGSTPTLWLRYWRPNAAIEVGIADGQTLEPYQEDLASAISCGRAEEV